MNKSDFVDFISGTPYDGELPTGEIAVTVSSAARRGTLIDRARPKDPNYEQVLVAYMFMHGWVYRPNAQKQVVEKP